LAAESVDRVRAFGAREIIIALGPGNRVRKRWSG